LIECSQQISTVCICTKNIFQLDIGIQMRATKFENNESYKRKSTITLTDINDTIFKSRGIVDQSTVVPRVEVLVQDFDERVGIALLY
jgi:hypothetical protein